MTVKELKEIVPLADVYVIREDVRYLVRLAERTSQSHIAQIAKELAALGIKCVICDGDIRFYAFDYDPPESVPGPDGDSTSDRAPCLNCGSEYHQSDTCPTSMEELSGPNIRAAWERARKDSSPSPLVSDAVHF